MTITDTPTIYIDGEYLPAKWEYHINDVVEQWVLVLNETNRTTKKEVINKAG